MIAGRFSRPPIMQLIGFHLAEAENGRAVFESTPGFKHYNPLGTVHGGYARDAARFLHGLLGAHDAAEGHGYTTLEFKVSLVRAITADTGRCAPKARFSTAGAASRPRRAGSLTRAAGCSPTRPHMLVFELPAKA